MKTKINKSTNEVLVTPARRMTSKRRALLESYFSNAVVLAALLESAQNELAERHRFL